MTSSRRQPARASRFHWSRSPLVWWIRCRILIVGPKSGSSGMWVRTSSSRESSPWTDSMVTAKAVNCFETDATWKIVLGWMGTSYSSWAWPYPFS